MACFWFSRKGLRIKHRHRQLIVLNKFTRRILYLLCCDLLQLPHKLIGLITEWKDATGKVEVRDENSDLGGTMRLGAQVCPIVEGTLAASIYGAQVNERHRHRYEVNNHYVEQLKKAGLVVSARTPTEDLCEMIELPSTVHPWFVGVQFHPEFTSNPRAGHPLFKAYVQAAIDNKTIDNKKA